MKLFEWLKTHILTFLGIGFLIAACIVSNIIYFNIQAMEKNRITEFDNFGTNLSMSAKEIMVRDDGFVMLASMMKTLSDMSHVRYIEYYQGRGSSMKAGENEMADVEIINKLKALNGAKTYKQNGRLYVRKELPRYDVLEDKGSFYIVYDLSEYMKKREQIILAIGLILLFAVILAVLMILLEKRNMSLIKTKSDLEKEKNNSTNLIKAITHDAKHFLTVINLRLNGLLREYQQGRKLSTIEDDLQLALENTKSINTFFDSLVEAQRIQNGEEVLCPEHSVGIMEIINDVVQEAKVHLEEKGMRCPLSSDSSDLYVFADPKAIKRVLMNLIVNAVKFSREKTDIEINVKKKMNRTWVYVKDQGKGIDPKYWERIFEPFVRLDTKTKGTGYGLTTSRKLIEMSGGKLKVIESVPNEGTVFGFSLLTSKHMEK